jgi:tetratricopeptide (TPR) repeat protein
MTTVKGKKVRTKTAGDVFSHYETAIKAVHANKYAQAIKLLDQIEKKFPTEIDVLAKVRSLQRVCKRQGEKTSKKQASSQSAEAAYNLGVYHHNNADFDKALDEFQNALKLAGDDSSFIYYAIASSQVCSGNNPAALEALTKAIEMNRSFRFSAAHDPDFDALSKDEAFRNLMGSA